MSDVLRSLAAASLLLLSTAAAGHSAIWADPPADVANPARMEVLHIPSGSVKINGVAYLAAGAGPHPTIILAHGLPGNEKNLDLAQALRRAGWNAVTFNYRGSWGSPGSYRFTQNPEDVAAVLAYLRNSANAAKLGIDTTNIVLAGHSMGGWAATLAAARDGRVSGLVLISTANMGKFAGMPRGEIIASMADSLESLADTSPEMMTDEIVANAAAFDFEKAASALVKIPLLVLSSDDDLAPQTDALAAAVVGAGGKQVRKVHVATDHSWSGARIRLQSEIVDWLDELP